MNVLWCLVIIVIKFSNNITHVGAESSSLNWLLKLYNPYTLGNFSIHESNVSNQCAQNMKQYLEALDEEQLWAAKMTDASGRYTPQFFYGNNFWLGSMSLCGELSTSYLEEKTPPFQLRFFVARLLIKIKNFPPPEGRLVFLGVCLPISCSADDVTYILKNAYEPVLGSGKAEAEVLRVRPVPGDFNLMKNKTFYALGGAILVIVILMAAGTFHECIYLRRRTRKVSVRAHGLDAKSNDSGGDIENNNSNQKSSLECNAKVKVYEVNKKGENKKDGNNSQVIEESKGFFPEFFQSFSIISNSSKIMNCSSGSRDSLSSVHGLRFLSLAWVIMVHTYLQIFAIGENKALRAYTEKMFLYQTVGNATYSVDTFFLISGLLVSFLYFKNVRDDEEHTGSFGASAGKFVTLILYRFIRLTPVYIIVLGLVHLTMTILKDISVFETPLIVELNCEDYWWRNIIYINNFFPKKEMCMLWSWYMAVDTQFFVLSTMLLLLSKRYFKLSAATMFAILISSWCTTAFISYTNQYRARVQEPLALFDELYDKPWTRIGPYIVGMSAGWYLQRCNCTIKIPTVVVLLGWTSSLGCLLSLVYGTKSGLNVAVSSIYAALGHTAWGLSLAWMVIACSTGYGGWINTVLSWPAFYPLSRLTYCAYLVHPVIMFLTNYVMDGPFHMHNGVVLIIFLGNLVASFVLSFLLSIAFEAPFVRILKLLLSPAKKK